MSGPGLKTLVLVPHCDDEILGAGHLISLSPKEVEVVVCVSHGGTSEELPHVQGNALASWREEETTRALGTLGVVAPPLFLRLCCPFEWTGEETQNLLGILTARGLDYERIVTSHPRDRHHDHQMLGKAIQQLDWFEGERWFFACSTQAGPCILPGPDKIVNLSGADWQAKMQLINIFRSQRHFLPSMLKKEWHRHERFWIQ